MSGFFPWNFRAGRSGGGIEATGCPLEDHPNWSIVAGAGPSNLCWDSADGKSVLVNADSDDLINLAYRNINMVNGSIAATITMVSSSDQDWMLPLCARMINANNLIGARWNDSQFEVVQRRVATWSTLFTGGPLPVIGDQVVFLLSSKFWKLIVNGAVVGEGETTLADDPGYWGMSQHRSPGFVGHRLFSGFEVTDTSLAKTPCMTGPDTPYGVCSASSEFSGTYPAWKGMNCTTVDLYDAWISENGLPMPQWIQWIGPAGQPPMVPDRLHVEARDDIENTDRGPESLTLQGSNDNGQSWDDIQSWTGLDFGTTPIWDASVTGSQAYLAIRLRVDNIRDSGFYCQIGTFTVFGHAGQAAHASVAFSGKYIERTADAIYVQDIAAGGDTDDKAQLFSGTVLDFNRAQSVEVGNNLVQNGNYSIMATGSMRVFETAMIVSGLYGGVGLKITDADSVAGVIKTNLATRTVAGQNLNFNKEYRFCLSVIDGDKGIFYVDGLFVGEYVFEQTEHVINMDGDFIFGKMHDGDYYQDGTISNVQIWDAALSADDVQYDFDNSHRCGLAYERSGTTLTPANLKGFWPLIDGSGHIAHDHSGNAHHGTLVGFAADDSQWVHALPSPLVPQTALMEWCIGSNDILKSDNITGPEWYLYRLTGTANDDRSTDLELIDGDGGDISPSNGYTYQAVQGEKFVVSCSSMLVNGGPSFRLLLQELDASETILETHSGSIVALTGNYQDFELEVDLVNENTTLIKPIFQVTQSIVGDIARIRNIQCSKGERTAYIITSDTPATNALVPLDPWQTVGKFFRGYGELNWNGRSWGNAGNWADVNASSGLIIETIFRNPEFTNGVDHHIIGKLDSYFVSQHYDTDENVRFFIYPTSDEDAVSRNIPLPDERIHHIIFTYDSRTSNLSAYIDGILYSEFTPIFENPLIDIVSEPLVIGERSTGYTDYALTGHPLIALYVNAEAQALIDEGMDDVALAMFSRARQIYPLGDIMPEVDLANWTGINVGLEIENRGVRVRSTDDSSYSLHTWDAQTIPVEEGETYTYRFWAMLGDYDVANYTTFDVTNGVFLDNVVDYSGQLNHDEMTMIDIEIVIPAGCTELAISPFRGGDGPCDCIFRRNQAIFKR